MSSILKVLKFKDVPIGGRIDYASRTWVVLENYGYGLLRHYTGIGGEHNSVCCFVDEENGITLDTEVNFIN